MTKKKNPTGKELMEHIWKEKDSQSIRLISDPLVSRASLRIRYDSQEGLWHVDVMVVGEWVEVSSLCEEAEANAVANALINWKRGK